MQIAIASGKGGTGKTSVAVALLLANLDKARLLDCDVEEPNAHLFLKPEFVSRTSVEMPVPRIDQERCTRCGQCVSACQFNALANTGEGGILLFEELCHSCGSCARACPAGAIHETSMKVGAITESLVQGKAELITGSLCIGSSATPSVIRAVKKYKASGNASVTLVDSPPGTSCAFVAAVEDSDLVLLVADDTPFGLHDLKGAVKALKKMRIPFAVIINRCQNRFTFVEDFCKEKAIPVCLRIRESKAIAEVNAHGGSLLDALPELRVVFQDLFRKCKEDVLCSPAN